MVPGDAAVIRPLAGSRRGLVTPAGMNLALVISIRITWAASANR